jgi:hypothetical protein
MKERLIRCVKGVSWPVRGLVALIGAALSARSREEERPLHDSELIGEYNHRTVRLDAGNDPYGWYEED